MMFDGINLIGALAGAIASFVFGSIWYSLLSKQWMNAAGLDPSQTKPTAINMALTFLSQFLMAFIFAGIIYHTGGTSIKSGLISAGLVWTGIVFTTQLVNHRFLHRPFALTLIDTGHWLGVLIIQGIVIGAVGSWPTAA